jgi:hypothetical protein
MTLEEEFDLLFKSYGGSFNPKKTNHPEILENTINGCRNILNNHKQNNSKLPEAYFGFINNPVLNAIASKKDNNYFIGINIGTYFLLLDIFNRMLSSKEILTEFGNVSEESDNVKIFDPQITDARIFYMAKEPPAPVAPKNPVRYYLAQLLTAYSIKYLLLHEYAHIIFGHLDFLNSQNNSFECSELTYNNFKNGIDPLTSQILELDADSYAIYTAIKEILVLQENSSLIKDELLPFYKDLSTAIKVWLFAVYTLFRLFGNSVPKVEDLKKLSHPPSGIRQHILFATSYSVFETKPETKFLEIIPNLCVETMKEAESAFQKISIKKLNSEALAFAYKKESFDHVTFLMKHWNNVRPKLEQYAYGNLAPLYEENDPSTNIRNFI